MATQKIEKNFIRKYAIFSAAILALALGMISLPALAAAHKPDSTSGDVPVRMVVTVKAHHDGQVPAVSADDVKVYQRDKRDAVTSWLPLQGDRAGLQLYILIDDTSRDSVSLQFKSIAKFIEDQPDTTAIAIGYMRNGTVATVQELTKDHALAEKALRLPLGASVGYTSPYLSLSELMKKWPETADRREILMITSGIDPLGGGFSSSPYNNPYLQEAFDRAQRGGFIVYSIYTPGSGVPSRGFRTQLQQSGLDLLAQKTGGDTYYLGFGAPVDFTPYLDDVSYCLKHQYELTFLAKGSSKKPTLEPVKVKTEMPNMGLTTAEDGYVKTGS